MMIYNKHSNQNIDPIDAFYEVLRLVWEKVSGEFDVQAPLPEMNTLFQGIETNDPCMAAESIIRNMIIEVTQLVHRFSPWYKLPARAFGLVAFRDVISHKHDWRLASEAILKWQDEIEIIASEIDKKNGLIQAIVFIDEMDILEKDPGDPVLAACKCEPPTELLVTRKFLDGKDIVCKECNESFLPVAG